MITSETTPPSIPTNPATGPKGYPAGTDDNGQARQVGLIDPSIPVDDDAIMIDGRTVKLSPTQLRQLQRLKDIMGREEAESIPVKLWRDSAADGVSDAGSKKRIMTAFDRAKRDLITKRVITITKGKHPEVSIPAS
ncbi:hypothetical protein ABIF07_003901 [Bradyrhizobium elkanii]|uniref:hypothetical protein n=1 Tax=Bradyrhizobium elkanii TaxID=29448 RepID=UPI002166D662|nr:hypothetical protein [Bradyrhizobium elkanii]MCS3689071.1 hypothetical protein [Bradyrhizobium elkanii]